ncbi:MAG: alanine racemase [Selenomonadaceae bacterium]|nr:alanine racemase [Selenomonadaceae bacterium]MBQ7723960.1 alanine racemase [Selenomonadaceae bacterium]
MILRDVYAEIDLNAIRHNFTEIRRHINPASKLCAVVKANAYGHGALEVSKVAVECGAEFLAVATVDEGLELRRAGFNLPILILGLIPQNAVEAVVDNDLTQAVVDFDFAKKISETARRLRKIAKVHLKIETGMGRIGIAPEKSVTLAEKISRLPNVELEGLFSHFADADSNDRTFTNHQIAVFKSTAEKIRSAGVDIKICHIAESAAALDIPEAHFDMVRSGIINYGLYPSANIRRTIELRPAMKLVAKIVYVKKISAGVSIGYGRDFVAKRDSLIATLPLGYADGYIRAYKNFHVEVRGQLAPIAGRVCMDQTMIDVTDIDGVQVGDDVILFGSDLISADDAARHLNTINYEITCLVSSRVPRIFKA